MTGPGERAAQDRRRLAAPDEATPAAQADDPEDSSPDGSPRTTRDDEILREVPPHHG